MSPTENEIFEGWNQACSFDAALTCTAGWDRIIKTLNQEHKRSMKRVKKKILTAIIIAVMTVSLVACGSSATEETTAATETSEVVETTETIESSTEAEEEKLTTEESTESTTETDVNASTETSEAENASAFTYTDKSGTLYVTQTVNVRDLPDTSGNIVGSLKTNDEVTVTGQCNETGWYRISYGGGVAYVSNSYVASEKVAVQNNANSGAGNSAAGNNGGSASAPSASSGGVAESDITSFCASNGWALGSIQQVDSDTYTYIEACTGAGHYYGSEGFLSAGAAMGRNCRQAERVTLYENRNCKDDELYFVDMVYVRAN